MTAISNLKSILCEFKHTDFSMTFNLFCIDMANTRLLLIYLCLRAHLSSSAAGAVERQTTWLGEGTARVWNHVGDNSRHGPSPPLATWCARAPRQPPWRQVSLKRLVSLSLSLCSVKCLSVGRRTLSQKEALFPSPQERPFVFFGTPQWSGLDTMSISFIHYWGRFSSICDHTKSWIKLLRRQRGLAHSNLPRIVFFSHLIFKEKLENSSPPKSIGLSNVTSDRNNNLQENMRL